MKKTSILRSFTAHGTSNIIHLVSVVSCDHRGVDPKSKRFGVVNKEGKALSVLSRNLGVASRMFESRIAGELLRVSVS